MGSFMKYPRREPLHGKFNFNVFSSRLKYCFIYNFNLAMSLTFSSLTTHISITCRINCLRCNNNTESADATNKQRRKTLQDDSSAS